MQKTTLLFLVCISLLAGNCRTVRSVNRAQQEHFNRELLQLQTFFHIPALSVLVKQNDQVLFEKYAGLADNKNQSLNDSLTQFPIASLTKIFAAVGLMKLCEAGRLNLEEPVNKYVSGQHIPDSIQIKHVLSHTSQGKPGEHFYYSGRFGWLTAVIEKSSGKRFEQFMQEEIFTPAGLTNTWLLKDSSSVKLPGRKLAQPYWYEGAVKEGRIEYGYSASAGIVSTVRDLAKFDQALDRHILISEKSLKKMFTPFNETLPYGSGIFSQRIEGQNLVWGYGQFDAYSALYIKVPAKRLTLIVTANNNLMSDPARLIYGDIAYSLFAWSFLKNYVYHQSGMPLLEDMVGLESLNQRMDKNTAGIYRRKLLAQALAESFMEMGDRSRPKISEAILDKIFRHYPDCESYASLSLLHNLMILKFAALQQQKVFTKFDSQIEKVGRRLLAEDPGNPYANFYLGNYYSLRGEDDSAYQHFNNIVNLRNFSRGWYTIEAENWIKTYHKKKQ